MLPERRKLVFLCTLTLATPQRKLQQSLNQGSGESLGQDAIVGVQSGLSGMPVCSLVGPEQASPSLCAYGLSSSQGP